MAWFTAMPTKRNTATAWQLKAWIVLCASIAGVSSQAAAQAAKPGADEDLRAAYATAADIADGRRIAETACARCHGANGIGTAKGIPHLAGQRPAYLHLQMQSYRQSARVQTAMDSVVKFLSDDALYKVAAYYASLEPPRPAAAAAVKGAAAGKGAAAKGVAARQDPAQAGKAAAAACTGCHGDNGVTAIPGTPSLVGLDPKYFTAAMLAYKSGARSHDVMKPLAAALSDADLSGVALFFALQKPARAQTPAAGNQAAGKKAAASCGACHGDQGVSGNPATPSLAGQDAQYLEDALRAYRKGTRKDESMKAPAASLDDKVLKDLAAYYASRQPQAPNVRRPLTIAEWADRCDRCHGVNGNSTDPRMPRLSAQSEEWLDKVLRAYQSGARKSSAMAAMSALMSEGDVKELAAHYSRQTARSVTYVVLPPTK